MNMKEQPNQRKTGQRIAKVIARAGLASRREAEAWIAAGRIAVNGTTIASPAIDVTGSDQITVDGEPLPARQRSRLFLYHKPRGLMTTHADPQGRATIFQNLPRDLSRLISVGRLDFNTEGLLLLTNDGALARLLELPATGWLRRYRVRAHGSITQDKLHGLHRGVTIDGMHYGPIEAALDRVQGSNVWLTLGIREGKNREVRNVLGHLGLSVTGSFASRSGRSSSVSLAKAKSKKFAPGYCASSSATNWQSCPGPISRRHARQRRESRSMMKRARMKRVMMECVMMKRVLSRSKKNREKDRNIALHPIMPGASTKKANSQKRCTADFMVRAASARKFRREMNRHRLIY